MPGQLLPLRLFSNSISATAFSLSTMKLGKSIQPPRGVSIFSRMFPFKLKYLGLSPNEGFGRRRFSSISSSGRRISAIRHNGGVDRGEKSQVGSFRGRGERSGDGKPKTLIDSEDELSDWISELKTDSFRVGTSSESDGDRSVLRLRGGAKGGGGGRDSSATNFRDTFRNEKGGRNDFQPSKRPRDSRPPDFGVSRNSKGAVFKSSRGSPSGSPSKKRFISESEEDEDEDEELSPRRGGGNGIRGGGSSPVRRSGRDSESSFSPSRGGGNSQKGRKPSLLISEEEEEQTDDSVSSFEDLLSDEDSDEDNDTEDPKAVNLFPGLAKEDKAQPMPKASSGKDDSYLSQTRFDQCAVSSLSLKGIKDAGYERMTVVQEATLPVILKGKDVLAKAKTGTGKTVAFLLPAIEVIVKSPRIDRDQKRPPFFVLVVCPTRELANQAAAEANKLLKYHPSIGVQVVIGGVRLALEQKRMQANPCQILVATPGRLKDHIENTAGFATRLMGVKVLVLDEADQLLDMGFRKDIEKIIAAVPKQRQTLLFSATVSPEVRQICLAALKRDHEFINTVQEGGEETHSQVRQMHLVAPLDQHFPLLYVLLREHISEDVDYKVLVFCTTANVTSLVASLLSELNLNIREIHSRKNQSYRTRISDEFRKSKGLILVTSDVSARGVDYPDVSLVIQVGLPSDRQQYIHRLGRTGRKGKEGQGILLLAPWEQYFLSNIKDLPITKAPIPSVDPDTKKKVERAMSQVDLKNKEKAYQAWLGFYNSTKPGRDKVGLVQLANEFSRTMGLDTPPAIPKQVIGKMGLRNVPGLRSA